MLSNLFKSLIPLAILTPALAVAAPKKAVKSQPAPAPVQREEEPTLLGGGSSKGSLGLNTEALKGLSVFGAYDFADSVSPSGGSNLDMDRAMQIGAQYEFSQFSPGVAGQVGGTYDFEHTIKNTNGLAYSDMTVFGELTAKLSPQLKVMGGLNYNFPSLKNAAPGASIKGKMGFQAGGSFQFARNFAVDARYRTLEMDVTGNSPDGTKSTTGIKVGGFILGGRYLF